MFLTGIITGGDWGFPVTERQAIRYTDNSLYTWADTFIFGIQQFFLNGLPFQTLTGLVAKIGITGEIYLKILLIFAFVFAAFTMFLLCEFLGCSRKIAFFGGLLYITLPFFFNYAAMGWLFVLFLMGILPLALIFFIKSVEEKKVIYSVLTGIFYFLGMINSQSVVWYPLVFLCLAIFLIEDKKSFFSYIKSLLIVFLVFLGLNTYLWFPLFFNGGVGLVSTKLGLSTVSLGTWARLSYLNILRGWGSLFNYQYETAYPKILIPLSFLLPIVAFFSLIFLKKRKLLLSFAVLSFITAFLFTLGPKTIVKFPFSDIFRDIARSLVLPSFSYIVMVTVFLDFIFKQKKRYLNLVGIILIVLFVANAYPFWTGELFGRQQEQHDIRLRAYNFPQGYFDLEKYLQEKKEDIKVLYLPLGGSLNLLDDKRFYGPYKEIRDIFAGYSPKPGVVGISDKGLGSATNFSLMLANEINQKRFLGLNRLLSLMAVKYVATRENAIPHFLKVNELLEEQSGLIIEKRWDKVSLFRNDNNFLPHFYIPQNIIYSPNDIEVLPEIVGLPGYELRSAIYVADNADEKNADKVNADNADSARITLMERADEVVVEGKLENQIDEKYFEKLEDFKNSVTFPYVRWKPGSWEWKLARLKEKYEEWRVRKNPEKLIDKKLFYAGKRISEMERFADGADKEIADTTDEARITLIIDEYKKKMSEVIEEIKKLGNWEAGKFREQVIKLRAYWERHKEKIEEGYRDIGLEKYRSWEGVFGELDEEIKGLEKSFDLENLEYSLEIPKEGKYRVYLKVPNSKLQISNKFQILPPSGGTPPKAVANSKFQIDGEEISNELMTIDEKWLEVGKINLDEGKHKITIQLLPSENLVGGNWQKLEKEATESGEIRLVSQGFFPKGENIVFQSIKDWEPGQLYYLSFEYKTEGGNLGVSVLEDKMVYKEEEEEIKTEKILDKKLRNWEIKKLGNWETFERVLRADENARGAKVYFYSLPEPDAFADIRFRNVKIYKIEQPKTILVSEIPNSKFQIPNKSQISNSKSQKELPKITFVKINPTKYRVKVEGAKEPYTLVFSESFHRGWKIYLRNWETEKLGNYGEIVASYFDGEIKEGTHKNIFLDKNIFETWGKKPIAEDRHYLVNGYANSWYITPEDVEGKENYELIVEFWPQRLFYIGLFISGITLIGCLGCLGWGKLRNWEIKKLRN